MTSMYEIERRGLTDQEITECEARRERAKHNTAAYEEARVKAMAALDAELGPLPPKPEYRVPKSLRTYKPSKEEGKAMALDLGFDPAVAGTKINVPDPEDEERSRREWNEQSRRRNTEYDRRSEIVTKQLAEQGITYPKLTEAHSLTFFVTELRAGEDSTVNELAD